MIRNIGIEEGGRILTDGNRYTRCGIVNADEETENEDLWAMATDELY